MIFLYSWLKDFVALDSDGVSAAELSERLTMCGVEVESISGATEKITGVTAAKILKIEKHPNADRLSLCEVTDGTDTVNVVCGASNMKEGDMVMLAHVGARLKGGFKIKKSKIRGEASFGMLCSEVELGIAEESEGIMILNDSPEPGTDINEYINLSETKIDIGITPNRPDLYSVVGIAREIAAITGAKLTGVDSSLDETGDPIADSLKVTVEETELCPRYSARVIKGLTVKESPDWLKRRLEGRDIRPINNVVDATNYVLIELGQPLHAFDHAKLAGGELIVRRAKKGETIETLDAKERKLTEGTLLICDAKGPQALAGIMGAKGSQVTESTTDIVLESAWFAPTEVRKRSRELGLATDSSFIFERGIDICSVTKALDRAASLIVELAGGEAAMGKIDIYEDTRKDHSVSFRVERAEELLGTKLKSEEAKAIFESLGMEVSSGAVPGEFFVTPPTYRGDIVEEIDLIEEVARIRGYDVIEPTLPVASFRLASKSDTFNLKKRIKETLVHIGLYEVINYTFVSTDSYECCGADLEDAVKIVNPLSETQSVLRASLLPSLIENLKRNISQKQDELSIFEVAPVFSTVSGEISESWWASGLIYGSASLHEQGWNTADDPVDIYDAKGAVESTLLSLGIDIENLDVEVANGPLFHPVRAGKFLINGKTLATFAEVNPQLSSEMGLKESAYLFEMDISQVAEISSNIKSFEPLSRFPESKRDIAFVVDVETQYLKIYNSIKALGRKVVEKVELFDVYYDKDFQKGKRSLGMRITYRAKDRTLTSDEIDKVHTNVIDELKNKFSAEIRV